MTSFVRSTCHCAHTPREEKKLALMNDAFRVPFFAVWLTVMLSGVERGSERGTQLQSQSQSVASHDARSRVESGQMRSGAGRVCLARRRVESRTRRNQHSRASQREGQRLDAVHHLAIPPHPSTPVSTSPRPTTHLLHFIKEHSSRHHAFALAIIKSLCPPTPSRRRLSTHPRTRPSCPHRLVLIERVLHPRHPTTAEKNRV